MLTVHAAGNSLRLLTTFFATICYGETPRPSGPPFAQEIHCPHHYHPNGIRFSDGLPRPGLKNVQVVLSDDDSTLLGWNPWPACRKQPQLADLFLCMRECRKLDGLWNETGVTYAYNLVFEEKWRDGKETPIASSPSSAGSTERLAFSLKLGRYSLEYADERSRGGRTVRKPSAREYTQLLLIDGKLQACRFYEGTTEFIYGKNTSLLKLAGTQPERVLLHAEQQESRQARIVVRWSPDTSWYYVRVFLGNRAAGPGWRVVPKDQNCGEILSLPHCTELDEKVVIRWSRSDWP